MEKILFDKNHVKVTSEDTNNSDKFRIYWVTNTRESISPKGMYITTICKKYEDVVKESPLGFFYNSKEEVEYEQKSQMSVYVNYHVIHIYLNDKVYRIKYPYSCNDVKIGFDARPWDICIGDKSMMEHFIKALQKILDGIFFSAAVIKESKRTRDKVFTELFGNVNGYTTLSNDIKIVSHGFDPKESFRKRKKVSLKKNKK